MPVLQVVLTLWMLLRAAIAIPTEAPFDTSQKDGKNQPITPKVFIINMFQPEADIWYGIPEFNLLARNITVPGLSPIFPSVHCITSGDVCQVITGAGEINAATTITALVFSAAFDLKRTYFLIAGIAGVSPKVTTIGSVTFARYAVSVALQYEIDAREIPQNFSTGYFPQGSTSPTQYPAELYGTEVFEVNDRLRQRAISFAKTAVLNDTAAANTLRANYASNSAFKASAQPPSVVACDTATSDNYFTGTLLSEAVENTTALFTNGSAVYCSTEQEDTATLEALLRGAASKLLDFSRVMVMRTASDFDRPYAGETVTANLFDAIQGFEPSIMNIYLAGVKVVEGILGGWNKTFADGVKATNYVGDIYGTLGGEPDFGPGSIVEKKPTGLKGRGLKERRFGEVELGR